MLGQLYKKYILPYYKILLIIGGIIIIASAVLLACYCTYDNRQVDISKKDDALVTNPSEEPKIKEDINYYVDIKGAVTNPSVYQIAAGSRIADVIKLAGGLTPQADTSVINLSKKISDEMTIIIYSKQEMILFREKGEAKQEIIKYIKADCNCPDPDINDACINSDIQDVSNQDIASKISINNATKEALMTLSGIGDAKAQSIIDYRNSNGLFTDIEDIKNITGIGDSIFDKIKDYITL